MADKKTIAVLGATGSQGGGLVHAILADPNGGFAVRALTRDVHSDKAKELAKLGAEVVAADVDDVESLKNAFQDAYGAYCVTFFWNHLSPGKEFANATAMAGAAKHAGLEHVIWSTLEDTVRGQRLAPRRRPTPPDRRRDGARRSSRSCPTVRRTGSLRSPRTCRGNFAPGPAANSASDSTHAGF